MYPFAYLQVATASLVVWFILFIFLKKQRQEMLWMGIILGIAAPIQELWYTKDYWHPSYLGSWPWIEDIIFGFALGGIAAVIYETIFSLSHLIEKNDTQPHPAIFVAAALIAMVGMGMFVPLMNSIYAAILAFVIAWLILVIFRPDLFISSLGSALLMLTFTLVGYQMILAIYPELVTGWWELKNISGILLAGIPLEEFLWFGACGLIFGPLYELLKGIRLQKN